MGYWDRRDDVCDECEQEMWRDEAREEWRRWRLDVHEAKVAHDRAVAAAMGRHPSRHPAAIMRAEMDADLARDIAAQKDKTTRALDAEETDRRAALEAATHARRDEAATRAAQLVADAEALLKLSADDASDHARDLRARLGELDRSKPTAVVCHSGLRAHVGTRLLREHGFDAHNVSGATYVRDLALHRPATFEAPAAACGTVQACGAPGTLAPDSHDELHPLNVLAEAGAGALLLDVRSPAEFRSSRVRVAINLPLEQVTAANVRALLADRDPKAVLLLCASGGRARTAAKQLAASGLRTLVVQGGTNACRQAGLPMDQDAGGMISVERQVRIAAGAMVFTGVLLGTFVHPGFYGLSGFIGAGLVFAGVTDWCGMGLLLARAPRNR
jgi:rhodanese-related sulfurtransferase